MGEECPLPAAREKRVKNCRRRVYRMAESCGERRGAKPGGCGASYTSSHRRPSSNPRERGWEHMIGLRTRRNQASPDLGH